MRFAKSVLSYSKLNGKYFHEFLLLVDQYALNVVAGKDEETMVTMADKNGLDIECMVTIRTLKTQSSAVGDVTRSVSVTIISV